MTEPLQIYQTATGELQVRLDVQQDTVWLTQAHLAQLFETSTDNIGLHLKNIYAEQELDETSTTEDYSVVRQEGKRQVKRQIKHYNLEAILSVGYRISSKQAVRFRQWATRTLREHLTRGYTVNQQRLRQNAQDLETALGLVRQLARTTPSGCAVHPSTGGE
jgi:hypothetical protein